MPDQPSPRRRFQFSLRALMVGMTLGAVVYSVVLDRLRLIRERDEAKQELDNAKMKIESIEHEYYNERKALGATWTTMEDQLAKARLRIHQLERELRELKDSTGTSERDSAMNLDGGSRRQGGAR
jgi:hypothetical protein